MDARIDREVHLVNFPLADIISLGKVLIRIGLGATCLMYRLAIITGGACVPVLDVIPTQKTHLPVVVLFVGVGWRGDSTSHGCGWDC